MRVPFASLSMGKLEDILWIVLGFSESYQWIHLETSWSEVISLCFQISLFDVAIFYLCMLPWSFERGTDWHISWWIYAAGNLNYGITTWMYCIIQASQNHIDIWICHCILPHWNMLSLCRALPLFCFITIKKLFWNICVLGHTRKNLDNLSSLNWAL